MTSISNFNMTKTFRIASIAILALLQILFIGALVYDNSYNLTTIIFLIIFCVLGLIGILSLSGTRSNNSFSDLLLILFVVLGGISAYFLNVEFNTGAVIASALVGTIGSFIPLFKKIYAHQLLEELPKAIYCGSFIGMTAPIIAQGYSFILGASILGGMLYVLSKNTFLGVGGKLGTVAFGGVVITFFILFLNP